MNPLSNTYFKLLLTLLAVALVAGAIAIYSTKGAFTPSVSVQTNPSLTNGLVTWFTFDGKDMTQNVRNAVGTSTEAYLVNFTSTTTSAGRIGQALFFDAVNDYIRNDQGIFGIGAGSDFSFSVWVKPVSIISNSGFWRDNTSSSGNSFNILQGTRRPWVRWNSSEILVPSSGYSVPLNKWTHLVYVVKSGSWVGVYADGELKHSATHSAVTPAFTVFNYGYQSSATEIVSGLHDDVRFYNRALSQEEITRLYQIGATTKIATSPNTNPNLNLGLVGYWTFDGKKLTSTTATDDSGQGNNGTLTSMPTPPVTIPGRLGQALSFDGVNDLVSISAPLGSATSTADSSCAWAKTVVGNGASQPIWAQNSGSNQVRFGVTTANKVFVSHLDQVTNYGIIANTATITNGVWTHLCYVFNGSSVTPYQNGVALSSTGTSFNTNTVNRIGSDTNGSWQGSLDDVRIYNHALSQEEITRLYQIGATTKIAVTPKSNPTLQTGLVGHWTFDGKDLQQNATDSSGQGNTGYLTSFTSTTTIPGRLGQALSFDGVDDYVSAGTMGTLSSNFNTATISAWVKLNRTTIQVLAGTLNTTTGNAFYRIALNFDITSGSNDVGEIQVFVRSQSDNQLIGGITINTGISDGKWHHLVATHDKPNGLIAIYIDGVAKTVSYTSQSTGTTWVAWQHPLLLGALNNSGTAQNFWNGSLDDVRIYNRALSQEEITRLYQIGK